MLQTKFIEKIKTHFMFNNPPLRKSCRLWGNVDIYCRALQATEDNTLRRMPFARCTPKATNTHSEYVKLIEFPQQQWLRERAKTLRYTYIACRFTLCFSKDHPSFSLTRYIYGRNNKECVPINRLRIFYGFFIVLIKKDGISNNNR